MSSGTVILVLNITFFGGLFLFKNIFVAFAVTLIAFLSLLLYLKLGKVKTIPLSVNLPKINLNASHYLTTIVCLLIFIVLEKFIGFNAALFASFFFFSFWNKLDSRVAFLIALILLIITALLTAVKNDTASESTAILVYYFLVVGTIWQIVELKRESKHEKPQNFLDPSKNEPHQQKKEDTDILPKWTSHTHHMPDLKPSPHFASIQPIPTEPKIHSQPIPFYKHTRMYHAPRIDAMKLFKLFRTVSLLLIITGTIGGIIVLGARFFGNIRQNTAQIWEPETVKKPVISPLIQPTKTPTPPPFEIRVLNGTFIEGKASSTAGELIKAGWGTTGIQTGNANATNSSFLRSPSNLHMKAVELIKVLQLASDTPILTSTEEGRIDIILGNNK